MKLFATAQLNSLGLNTAEKKVALAVRLLIGSTMPNKSKALLKPEIKAVAARAEILAQPEQPAVAAIPFKAAIPAKAAIIGTGTATNPQFPAVAYVPAVAAVAAIPFRAAIPYSPAVAKVTAVPALYANVYSPLPEFLGSVLVDPSNSAYDKVNLVLPYSPAAIALGLTLDTTQIQEVTAPNAYLGDWQGSLTGITPTTDPDFMVGGVPGTVEQFLHFHAKQLTDKPGTVNKINTALYRPNPTAPAIPVIAMELFLGKSLLG
jgi:hypothetical protein